MLADKNSKVNPKNVPMIIRGSFLYRKETLKRLIEAIAMKTIMARKIAKNPPREKVKAMAVVVKNKLN